ncbi:protein ENHANCED DISEASE RESISTANCE 2-like [Curcuma longa]|uniref:protein ENHANCED DISEASE RESISTANCE 2-like n=1 Tax=Curcuma longa TaxID=136217 RepID=UPI003D9F5D2C
MAKVVYEGWMVRYGRRRIGKSYMHMRYFVLERTQLAYYKKKPTSTMVPLQVLVIDGNCRVEDRGLKTQQGQMVYVLCIYNKKEKHDRMMMAAYNIQDALNWKEKIESIIDQQQGLTITNDGNQSFAFHNPQMNIESSNSSSSQDRHPKDEDENSGPLHRGSTMGNGPPDSVPDWTRDQLCPKKRWQLVKCQNGLRIFEELLEVDYLPRRYSKAMKAVGVVEATCETIFELVMSMEGTRFEWDCSFHYGCLVEEVDGHTAILYHRMQQQWFPMFVWPRDLCYVRYWRRNDDGSYVVLFHSREHKNCGPQPGCVRAHIESGGFKISPLKSRNGGPRTQVQHLMQIDLKGWLVGYFPLFQQHSLLQMLNSVAGMRELFSQTDEIYTTPRIPMMVNMTSDSSCNKQQKAQEISIQSSQSLNYVFNDNRIPIIMDEDTDEDEENQILFETEDEVGRSQVGVEPLDATFDTSCFSGNLHWDEGENSRNCYQIPDGNNFKVRGANYFKDKSKVPAGNSVTKLVAVDWLKSTKRMDHVVRRPGCAAQVASKKGLFSLVINLQIPGSTHYSMVFYNVKKQLEPGSLFQRFVDGDDEFRNSRLKLIPSVPKGSWIVRQSVGSSPCLLGKAVDCTYIRGDKYLEIDVDIGSSTVANGVLGLVFGVITSLVVDMAFLIQAIGSDELPERLIGAVRIAHIELSSAVSADIPDTPPSE